MVATAAELDVVGYLRRLFGWAKQERNRRLDAWQRSYRMVHNRSWSPAREPWMPSPQASEIFPIIAALVAWMTEQRPMLMVSAAADPHSPFYDTVSEVARDLEKVLESNWQLRKTTSEIEKMLWDGWLYGTGFLKSVWESGLEDGLGDARTVRIDPFTFYPDPMASNIEDANFFIEARTISIEELERKFPGADIVLSEIEGTDESSSLARRDDPNAYGKGPMANPGGISGAPPRFGLPGASDRVSGAITQGVSIYECWTRESQVYIEADEEYVEDRWRVRLIAGNRLLFGAYADEIFGHGRHPYTRYVPTDIGDFWGVALVEHLTPLQMSINRLLAAVQHNAELTGNPVFLEDKRAGISRTKIVNRPGVRLEKNSGAEAKWMEPPQIPTYVMDLIRFYIGEMERVSGLSAISRGVTPPARTARGVLDASQEGGFVRVRNALRNLELSLNDSGQLAASLIVENYTAPRMVSITGPQGEQSAMLLKSRHFYMPAEDGELMPMKFSLWVQAGSALPTSRQARAAEADMLYALGGIDREALLDAHDYPNRKTILDRITQQIQQGVWSPPGKRQRAGRAQSPGGG
jgi:hypothetical protein